MEQINSVNEFLNKLKRYYIYQNVFYRGQLEKYLNITSSISRNKGFTKNEHSIYNEAIKMKSIEFKDIDFPIERLSKMQHYGIPTRLIDLTIDPLIALFFAVQNIDNEYPGNVYVFVQNNHSFMDKRIKLLSLLATLNSYEIDQIINEYYESYSEKITKEEIIDFASKGAFIEHTTDLQKSNERLCCQKGTFAVCGNLVENDIIKKTVLPLDSIRPTMIIRIPYEHKHLVKKELDEKYNINETTIYPEFPSVADYLKEKYREVHFEPEGSYNIVEAQDISHAAARRVSLVIVLNKVLRIEEVKRVGIEIINKYKVDQDVVWIYIAKNGDDYIIRNWIVRGQWIRETLDPRYKPHMIGLSDEEGYSWSVEKSFSTLSDYYAEYVFEDDKVLYTVNMKTFEKLKPYYSNMVNAFDKENIEKLQLYLQKNKREISKYFMEFSEYGYSRNDEFNKYLNNFQELALQLDNAVLWIERNDLNERAKEYQIKWCFRDAKKHFEVIIEKANYWREFIQLTEDEYKKINQEKRKKKDYQYTQTIPLNPNGLKVTFNLDISKNEDNIINVKGITNIFDKASLMLSIRDSKGSLLGQSKTMVKDGKFNFGKLSKEGEEYSKGLYEANISLAIPSVQDKDFVAKAGIEYENLAGEYVDRSGIGPMVNYTQQFNV